jgi:hypothetical protein
MVGNKVEAFGKIDGLMLISVVEFSTSTFPSTLS